jgi:predicted RNase H-like HicB family nuclease
LEIDKLWYHLPMNQEVANYTVAIQKSLEGGYIAFVSALPGCMTQGETLEEVKDNIADAVEGYLAVLREVIGLRDKNKEVLK